MSYSLDPATRIKFNLITSESGLDDFETELQDHYEDALVQANKWKTRANQYLMGGFAAFAGGTAWFAYTMEQMPDDRPGLKLVSAIGSVMCMLGGGVGGYAGYDINRGHPPEIPKLPPEMNILD